MIRFRYTTDNYLRLHETGVLKVDERVELIDGDIEVMSFMGIRHDCVVDRLNDLVNELLARKAIVSVHSPAQISDYSMPEPDVTVKKYRSDFYATRRATVEETLLFVEVAETSIDFDRETKMPLYGRSGIRESWLIDLPANVVYRFTNPRPDGYGAPEEFRAGDTLISTIAGVELKLGITDLLA